MLASFAVSAICFLTVPGRWYPLDDPRNDSVIMLITVGASTVIWLAVTYLTPAEDDAVLDSFYRRVRPGGPGWAKVSERLRFGREQIPGGALAWTNWIAGIVAVYSTLFGIGKFVFGEWGTGLILLVIATIAFAWIARSFRSEPEPPAMAMAAEERVAAD